MFVDASALTSMITGEADARELLARLANHGARETSPLAVWETVVAVSRILDLSVTDGQAEVEAFIRALEIEVRQVSAESRVLAISAFDRYGKGRHPAALNFGDCFAYACAQEAGGIMLYKGDDFPLTDIRAA
jgi:ribonuclease VapC